MINRKDLRNFINYCIRKDYFKHDFIDYELADQYIEENNIIDLDKIEKDIDNLLKEDLIVYEFCYNDSCHECSPLVISIHLTRKGAEMALEFHKQKEEIEHLEAYGNNHEYKYDYDKSWGIRETIILK